MSFYTQLAAAAKREIEAKGRSVTLRSISRSYNPATDIYTPTNSDVSVIGIFTDYTQFEIDGDVILKGDKRLIIAGDSVTVAPSLEGIVIDDSLNYKIMNVETVRPAATVLLYKLQLRR